MTSKKLLEVFLEAMGGQWVVERYSVDENGKLRIHYRSLSNPVIEWAHNPMNALSTIPKIGEVGMLGFLSQNHIDRLVEQ